MLRYYFSGTGAGSTFSESVGKASCDTKPYTGTVITNGRVNEITNIHRVLSVRITVGRLAPVVPYPFSGVSPQVKTVNITDTYIYIIILCPNNAVN